MFAHRRSDGRPVDLRKDVEIVAELVMPFLLYFPVTPSPRFTPEVTGRISEMEWLTRVEEWFHHIVPGVRRAERLGVTILLKPHGGIGGTGEDLALIAERRGSVNVRVLYDPGNVVYYVGVRLERDVASVAGLATAEDIDAELARGRAYLERIVAEVTGMPRG